MRAVIAPNPGGPEALQVVDRPVPSALAGEVVIDVVAAGVNKADTLQRMGFYNPPAGATDILGLEVSGRIREVGDGVTAWQVGDEVCALLTGGGYAEQVAVPAGQVMAVPAGVDLVQAAALPETTATVWSNVFMLAGLQPGQTFLVHGGGGGIGTTAIQIASALSAKVFTTAGSPEKLAACAELGADVPINYRTEDFVEVIAGATNGVGVDVILDNMGAKYLSRNVDALATAGHLVVIGLQGGVSAELNLATVLAKRASVSATSLRPRPVAEKSEICADVVEHVWPLVADGQVVPQVHTVLPLEQVGEAHRIMDSSEHTGKILLVM